MSFLHKTSVFLQYYTIHLYIACKKLGSLTFIPLRFVSWSKKFWVPNISSHLCKQYLPNAFHAKWTKINLNNPFQFLTFNVVVYIW